MLTINFKVCFNSQLDLNVTESMNVVVAFIFLAAVGFVAVSGHTCTSKVPENYTDEAMTRGQGPNRVHLNFQQVQVGLQQ